MDRGDVGTSGLERPMDSQSLDRGRGCEGSARRHAGLAAGRGHGLAQPFARRCCCDVIRGPCDGCDARDACDRRRRRQTTMCRARAPLLVQCAGETGMRPEFALVWQSQRPTRRVAKQAACLLAQRWPACSRNLFPTESTIAMAALTAILPSGPEWVCVACRLAASRPSHPPPGVGTRDRERARVEGGSLCRVQRGHSAAGGQKVSLCAASPRGAVAERDGRASWPGCRGGRRSLACG